MSVSSPFSAHLHDLVSQYLSKIADRDESLPLLRLQMQNGDRLDLRTTFPGHVTNSAFVLSPDYRQILLIEHITIGRWLQPGGHYEGDGLFWKAAEREAIEETAVLGLALHPWHCGTDLPFIIDSHTVPGKVSRNEPEHVHHDFQYLFVADPSGPLVAQEEEVHGARWAPIEEAADFSLRLLPRLSRHGLLGG